MYVIWPNGLDCTFIFCKSALLNCYVSKLKADDKHYLFYIHVALTNTEESQYHHWDSYGMYVFVFLHLFTRPSLNIIQAFGFLS